MKLFFDTETTGLRPGHIIQLAYIIDYGNTAVGKNFYFDTDYIEPTAVMVHGITRQKLATLSGGKTFADYADEIIADFSSADLIVAHNFGFDLNFLIAECNACQKQFLYKNSLDTMRHFTPILKLRRTTAKTYKYPKLSELAEFYAVDNKCVYNTVKALFSETANALHDAMFDTTTMFLAVKQAEKNGQV